MSHHNIDPYPFPKDMSPIYINEPWLIDKSLRAMADVSIEIDNNDDNIRVYVPLDISATSIIRRLNTIISFYGEANEENEFSFSTDVNMLISQIEIYDQLWVVRHGMNEKRHSVEATDLVRRFIKALDNVPDGCAELFPFNIIEELREEYL